MSHDSPGAGPAEKGLAEKVKQLAGEDPSKCYQCGKCSAGCPLAAEMDFPPSQIVRMLQLGFAELDDKALGSQTIWLCLTCETCHSRCPKEVDLPRIMEVLREESLRRRLVNPKARQILAFHQAFLDSIRGKGRLFEMGLITRYKAATGNLFQDLMVAPKLLVRGKLSPFAHTMEGKAQVAAIFKRILAEKDENG
jgi:heterodisulfide reductase subunit C2